MTKCVFYVIIFFTLLSCKNKSTHEVEKILNNWIGKEIIFPEDMFDDSLSIRKDSYKIVFYVDSVGCFTCKLDFRKWHNIITEFNAVDSNNVDFVFILQTVQTEKIKYLMKWDEFEHPIYFDEYNSFGILNKLPENSMFHTFLLDSKNRIMAIGDPVYNSKIKELFSKIICGQTINHNFENNSPIQTELKIGETSNSLGTFHWSKEQKTIFSLKNIGSNPLVIYGISTSCGCTTVEYSKEPIQSGKKLSLKVKYKAEHPEHFNKTIFVYCNAKGSPFRLNITGNAI